MKNKKQKSIFALALLLGLGFLGKTWTQHKFGRHYSKDGLGNGLFDNKSTEENSQSKTDSQSAFFKDGTGTPPAVVGSEGNSFDSGHDSIGGASTGRTARGLHSNGAALDSKGLVADSVTELAKSQAVGSYAAGGSVSGNSSELAKGVLGTMKSDVAALGKVAGDKVSASDVSGKRSVAPAIGSTDAMARTSAVATAPVDSLKDGSKVGLQEMGTAGKNGLVRAGGTGDKPQESFPGEKTPPQAIAVSDIRGSVFGPVGLEGDSKEVKDVPGFTKLWEPQNHNPVANKGKQTQIYQTMAAGQVWDRSSQAMKVAAGAQFQYANWLETQPHRFGMTPVDSAKEAIGARVEVATLNPYDRSRFDANQPPDEAKFSAGNEVGFKLVQCAIHPEIAFVMEIIANDLQKNPMLHDNTGGGAHQDAKMELRKLNPMSGLASFFGNIPKLVFASASK